MDSRDILEEPVRSNNPLFTMYDLQKELLDHYIGIEGLPQYPIDINPKKSQTLLKDFTSRVIEELAEGYESLVFADDISANNQYWMSIYTPFFNKEDFKQCLNHLQNTTEEFADATHFMLELLIYANIQPEDINNYVLKVSNKLPISLTDNDYLQNAMNLGTYWLTNDFGNEDIRISSPISTMDFVKIYEDIKIDNNFSIDTDYILVGKYYSKENVIRIKNYLWDVTYLLNISRNLLKNKPWKQSPLLTDDQRYQEILVKSFITMVGLFYITGINSEKLYRLYFKKNKVNQFRIRSNY